MSRPGTSSSEQQSPEDVEMLRLEVEFFETQKQLRDIQELNQNMQHENSIREEQIRLREQYIINMKGKIMAELQVIETEELVLKERIQHSILLGESSLSVLQRQHERLVNVERENADLRQAIRDMNDNLFNCTKQHASTMHAINRDVRLARTTMESTLRSELANLDLTYQKKAFVHLTEKKKKAMLRNSQLKDEIAIQDIGINNLTTRLKNQDVSYANCMQDVKKMNKKAKRLRDRLGLLTSTKVCQIKILADVTKIEQEMQSKLDIIAKELEKPPIVTSLEDEILEALNDIQQTKATIELWNARLAKLQNIYFNIKPVGVTEETGAYNNKIFTVNSNCRKRENTSYYLAAQASQGPPSHTLLPAAVGGSSDVLKPLSSAVASASGFASGSGSPTKNYQSGKSSTFGSRKASTFASAKSTGKKEERGTNIDNLDKLTLSDILNLIQNDVDLMKVFEPIHGKESNLVVADERTAINDNQNMAAWLAYEILDLWDRSYATVHPSDSNYRIQSEVEQEFSMILSKQRSKIPTNIIVTDTVIPNFAAEINDLVQKLVNFDVESEETKSIASEELTSSSHNRHNRHNHHSSKSINDNSEGDSPRFSDDESITSDFTNTIGDDAGSDMSSHSDKMFKNFTNLTNFKTTFDSNNVLTESNVSNTDRDSEYIFQNKVSDYDKALQSCWYKKARPPDKFPEINTVKVYSKDVFALQKGLLGPRQTSGNLISKYPDNDIHDIRRLLNSTNEPLSPPRADRQKSFDMETAEAKFEAFSLVNTTNSSVESFLSEINNNNKVILDPLSGTRRHVKSSSNIPILCRSQSDSQIDQKSIDKHGGSKKIQFKKLRASDFGYLTNY